MSTQVIPEADIMRDVTEVLLKHLEPSKVARFWANWQSGRGNYLDWRDETFGDATVNALYEEIAGYRASRHDGG